jgi:hypothetical protein
MAKGKIWRLCKRIWIAPAGVGGVRRPVIWADNDAGSSAVRKRRVPTTPSLPPSGCLSEGLSLPQGSPCTRFRIRNVVLLLRGRLALLAELLDLRFRQMFYADEEIAGAADADQLVKFHLNRRAVPVLRVLDEEDHQECDDGRSGVVTSCQVLEKPNSGPVTAQTAMTTQHRMKAAGVPAAWATRLAILVNCFSHSMAEKQPR